MQLPGTCTVAGCTGITVPAGETLTYTVSADVETPLSQTSYDNVIVPTGGTCAPGACTVTTPTVSLDVNKFVNSFQSLGPGRYRVVLW